MRRLLFGGSKGGKGTGKGKGFRRGNPIGRDGQKLKRSICESEGHLRRFCPWKGACKGNSSSSTPGPFVAQPAAANAASSFVAPLSSQLVTFAQGPLVRSPTHSFTMSSPEGAYLVAEHVPL